MTICGPWVCAYPKGRTTMIIDLATWLLEQIAEDEDRDQRVIRLARAMYEAWQPNNLLVRRPGPRTSARSTCTRQRLVVDREMLGVLAECDAKRRMRARLPRPGAFANGIRAPPTRPRRVDCEPVTTRPA